MENALLVGLSRQMALGRELDVVANNIANIEHHRLQGRQFGVRGIPDAGRARQRVHRHRPAHQLRAGPRHLARHEPGRRSSRPAIRSTSPSTATPSWWCRRRAASATRATARCRSTPPASSSPAKAIRCSATPGRSRCSPPTTTSSSARTASSRCAKARRKVDSPRGKMRLVGFDQPQRLQKDGGSTFSAPAGVTAGQRRQGTRVVQGAIEKSNVRGVVEMTRMIEITRSYTTVARSCSSRATCAAIRCSSSPKCRASMPEIEENVHARAQHRSDRDDGPGTQCPGHLQQHRQHAHHRLQAPARRVSGPDVRARPAHRRAGLGPGQHPAGRHRTRRRRQDRRHAAPDDARNAGADRQQARRRRSRATATSRS